MDINQIRELVRIAREGGVGEVQVEEEGLRVIVRMPEAMSAAYAGVAMPALDVVPVESAAAVPFSLDDVVAQAPEPKVPTEGERPATWTAVSAPLVGTFRTSLAEGEAPFVVVGDEVEAGKTLCVIETLKRWQEVKAARAGVVREVCLEDGAPVGYGTALLYIGPREASQGEHQAEGEDAPASEPEPEPQDAFEPEFQSTPDPESQSASSPEPPSPPASKPTASFQAKFGNASERA